MSVAENSGAEKAGLKPGDLIVKAEGKTVKTIDALNEIRDTKKAGEGLQLSVIRDGVMRTFNVILSEDVPKSE